MAVIEVGERVRGADRLAPAVLAAANINPVTRLATDYLNHFNNVVMLLDLVGDMPEFAEEILAWRPMSYPDYFAIAHFRERDLAIEAYHAADPAVRGEFEAVVAELDAAMAEAQRLLSEGCETGRPVAAALKDLARASLQPLIAKASGAVNAPTPEADEILDNGNAQDTIDELFH